MKKGIKFLFLIAMVFALLTPTTVAHGTEKTELVYPEKTTVFYNGNYYDTLANALKAAYMDTTTKGIKEIHCKANSDVGAMTHGHVADDMIIYGNGARVTSGECDIEIDTYKYNRESGNLLSNNESDLEKDITVTVKDLNGIAAWGERHTNHTINLNFENCKNMDRIYFTGTTGDININVNDCSFDSTKGSNENTTIYSNANGSITVNNTTFKNIAVGINLNHKMKGTQEVKITNSQFINCAQGLIDGTKTYAAPVRIVAQMDSVSKLAINNVEFNYDANLSKCGNGDILLGDGRFEANQKQGFISFSMFNTKADVMKQSQGYYTATNIATGTNPSKATTYNVEKTDLVIANDKDGFVVDTHEKAEFVAKKEASCTENGNVAHYHCPICQKNFKDEQFKEEVIDVVIKATGHKAVKVEAKDAVCTKEGNIEYWYCENCKKYFSDKELTKEIAKEEIILAKLEHNYKDGKCTVCGEIDPNYEPKEEPVKTDDENNIMLYASLAGLALFGVSIISFRIKNKRS